MDINMTFDDLRSFLEKRSRRCAILDKDFNILWDKDGFFKAWTKIIMPSKDDFFNKKEVIISVGSGKNKLPVSITKIVLSGGETHYICEAFDRETVAELAAKSEISEILKSFISEINDKIHVIQHAAEMCIKNPLVKDSDDLLWNFKNQEAATFELLSLSTNLNFYFNTFSYSEAGKVINIAENVERLVKKCNKLLGSSTAIILNSKGSESYVQIYEQVFTVVLLNIIQNAVFYSPADGKIEVSVFCDDDNVTVSITNEIGEDKMNSGGGAKLGIGLPLIERIAGDVGGRFFTEREGETYRAHISLPIYTRSGSESLVVNRSQSNFSVNNEENYIKRYLIRFIEK